MSRVPMKSPTRLRAPDEVIQSRRSIKEFSQLWHDDSPAEGQMKSDCDDAMEKLSEFVDALMAKFVEHAKVPRAEAFLETAFVGQALRGGVFVGHVNTDLDSVAGAIGAAHLFEGTPCIAEPKEKLNGEILFALEKAGVEVPPFFGTHPGAGVPDAQGRLLPVCLVDHNEPKQMTPALRHDPHRADRIAGLIDHHALSDGFASSAPLFIDVRPWGSMSTIVAHQFVRNNSELPKHVAIMLLCAILSDTLALRSVTTTPADRFAVALLARMAEVSDPDTLARQMFRAKTDWIIGLGPYEMLRGDQKDFECNGWKFGIAVLEVTTPEPVLENAAELIAECRCLKVEKGHVPSPDGGYTHDRRRELDFMYLFVVDVVKQESVMLVAGGRELALAKVAFPDGKLSEAMPGIGAPGSTISADQTLMHVGERVSRKKQFAPAFFDALKAGFECHKKPMSALTEDQAKEPETPVTRASHQQWDKSSFAGGGVAGAFGSELMRKDSIRVHRNYDAVFDALSMRNAEHRASLTDKPAS
eukprot:TRINITY_DN36397_c0_g1_i1.p1 TRINITY_DN36397_c0_g1~~TRINITY_DN36397_c0_g1_i1.p1  ORF type:complete len:529 (+),score=134.60 TRINITY_DN36397_c0_g1_i1:68-1654(+)